MKKLNIRNKKGSLNDIIYIMVLFIVVAIVSLICFKISNSFNEEITNNSSTVYQLMSDDARSVNTQVNDKFSGVLDGSMLFLLIGLVVISFMLAAAVRIHPVFIILYLILLSVIIILAAAFGNIYIKMANMPEFTELAERMYYTTKIVLFMPWFVGIFGSVLAIVQYSNWKESK